MISYLKRCFGSNGNRRGASINEYSFSKTECRSQPSKKWVMGTNAIILSSVAVATGHFCGLFHWVGSYFLCMILCALFGFLVGAGIGALMLHCCFKKQYFRWNIK